MADLALITRQLETLVQGALPLEESLNTVAQQTEKPVIRSMLLAVRARVLEGHGLAKSLAEFLVHFRTCTALRLRLANSPVI